MDSPQTASSTTLRSPFLIAHAVLLGVLCTFALLAVTTSERAGAASSTPGIGILRYGNTYPQASGYDRYSYVLVGLRDGAAAGALPTNSLQYMTAPHVQQSYLTGVSYEDAVANGWLLRNANGDFIRTPYGAWLVDIGNPGFRQRWLQNVVPILQRQGNEGIFIDDVVSTSNVWGSLPAKYPTHAAWEEAMLSFVASVSSVLRSHGFYVVVNANSVIPNDGRTATGEHMARWNERLAPHVDAIMAEYWVQTPHGSPEPLKLRSSGATSWTQHWDGWLDIQRRTQAAGADFFTVMYGSTSDVNAMRYGRGSFLLEWDGSGGAFMFEASGDPWHPEWTTNVGQPKGPKYRVGVGWRRDYTGGTVVVNPAPSTSQTFALGAAYTRADGTTVTSVTLGPVSALVLKGNGAAAPTPPLSAPANTALPTISGTAQHGKTLTSSTGSWSNAPTGHTFQWKRCDAAGAGCTTIAGATTSTYALTSIDVGRTVRSAVTASNGGGSATATSAASPVVSTGPVAPLPDPPPPPADDPPGGPSSAPSVTTLPTLAGTAYVGSTLTSKPGSWSGAPTSFHHQWLRCNIGGDACAPIGGATAPQYVLGDLDLFRTVRIRVTAANSAGARSAVSTASRPIGRNQNAPAPTPVPAPPPEPLPPPAPQPPAAGPAPANNVLPELAGTAHVGFTLSSVPGYWTGAPSSITYQWLRCEQNGDGCQPIAGATGSQYVLADGELFKTVRVRVTAVNGGGASSATSYPSRPIGPRQTSGGTTPPPPPVPQPPPSAGPVPGNTAQPVLAGIAHVGATLTSVPGSWSGAPTSFAYQWLRCEINGELCLPILWATASRYTLADADLFKTVRVRVIATNANGSTAATSFPSRPIGRRL